LIEFISYKHKPFGIFKDYYNESFSKNQINIEAMCLSTSKDNVPFSRYVNAKYIIDDKLIFFSNYGSNKAQQIMNSNQVACLFFWPTTKIQTRISGTITKSSSEISNEHFKKRSIQKNASAISSRQSNKVESFSIINNKYQNVLDNFESIDRPDYWGGYSICPNYFEFWRGDKNRLNKREEYKLHDGEWVYSILEP
jgi:pyridoxamine 5'-phosphate oxidase|tara:strand:- start:5996 stop:6583 length:588 start_codon:yes stop_codon:yes gene_type:complete